MGYNLLIMSWFKRFGRIVIFDTLATICFIGVILFGWLPGPGGIPLFLLGMSLLAVNHDWAERWLKTFRLKGTSVKRWIFPNISWVQEAYDSVAIIAMTLGGIIILMFDSRYIEGFAIIVIFFSLFVFLVNRDRFDSFGSLFRRTKRKTIRLLKKIKRFFKHKR